MNNSQLAALIYRSTCRNRGTTRNIHGHQPEIGFVVSIDKSRELVAPRALFGPAIVEAYVRAYAHLVAATPGLHFGTWVDNDRVYLDLVYVLEDREVAIAAARRADQLAIWDLQNAVEVRV